MKLEAGRDYLLFDGDCGVCSWSAEVAKRMDGGRGFIVEPFQAFDESELMRFGIDYEKCSRAVQVVTRKGRVHAGAFAVNYFLWRFPWSLAVFLIYAIPVLLLFEMIGYRIVANNRHRISKWLGLSSSCGIRRDRETEGQRDRGTERLREI
jgi:predicted DCC family thiol-disulfide oxidoreductase YuxK